MNPLRFALLIALCFCLQKGFCQINLVRDINIGATPNATSDPASLTVSNNLVYFTATDPNGDRELWKTDGTEAGTVRIKNINANGNSNPTKFINVSGVVFFVADDGVNGAELWKTNGTEAGTTLVKNITDGSGSTSFGDMAVNNTILFFTSGTTLWKSDGTAEGTTILKQNMGSLGALVNVNGVIFFYANDAATGLELWKTDGTSGGTVVVKDIVPGATSSAPTALSNINGTLFFQAYTPETGSELWKSDGTSAGTVMVKDIRPGTSSGYPGGQFISVNNLYNINGVAYFAADNGVNGVELWKSDGTEAGTVMVKDLNPGTSGSQPHSVFGFNGSIYFRANIVYSKLYKTDGTDAGTAIVESSAAERIASFPVIVNGKLIYEAYTSDVGNALWQSDGTGAGTQRVKDVNLMHNEANVLTTNWRVVLNGNLIFAGYNDLSNWELWKSDGTADGTMLLKEINTQGNSSVNYLTKMGDHVYFQASDGAFGTEIWKSDGTAGGTKMVKDINSLYLNSYPSYLAATSNNVYFTAENVNYGRELWKSDGTTEGTVMIKDAVVGTGNLFSYSYLPSIVSAGNLVFFISSNDTGVRNLWRTDGTDAGTFPIADQPVYPLVPVGNIIFFGRPDGVGWELWKTDGTIAGTAMVKDINPAGGSSPNELINVNGTLFFKASDGVNGEELWKSDGTGAGTVMVKNIHPTSSSHIFMNFSNNGANVRNGVLYFTADDGTNGSELWKSDGTEAGTVMVKDIVTGNGFSSNPRQIIATSDAVYFTVGNTSLWKSDGTANGTTKITGFTPDNFRGNAQPTLFLMDGLVYVISSNPDSRTAELWSVYGALACKTATADDLYVYAPLVVNRKIFFNGWSYKYGGAELFMYDATADPLCRKAQTISFAALPDDKRENYEPFNITATATSGLPVTFTSSNPDVASVSGNTVTLHTPGETEITASQPGDDIWGPAESVKQTLAVGVILGIDDEASNMVSAFPNPFKESFELGIDYRNNEVADVEVYSLTGKLIEKVTIRKNDSQKLGENWHKEMFVLKVKIGDKQVIRKVIKF